MTFHLDEDKDGSYPYIYPVLDDTQIICGSSGASSDNCVIKGGDVQVLLRNSLAEDYVRKKAEFHGVTFASSYGLSIAAWDSPETKVTFVDCHWKRNTGHGVIQNTYVPFTKVSSPSQAPVVLADHSTIVPTSNKKSPKRRALGSIPFQKEATKRHLKSATTVTKSHPNRQLLGDVAKTEKNGAKKQHVQYPSILDKPMFPRDFKLDRNTPATSSSSIERALILQSRNLKSYTAMEVELIGCSVSETFAENRDFFTFINTGGSMKIKDSLIHENDVTCNIISVGGSVSLDGSQFHDNDLKYNIAVYSGELNVKECVFEGNTVETEIITVDNSDNSAGVSELSVESSCFIHGNYTYSHIYLDPETQISTDDKNYANNSDSGLCNIFVEDQLSSCLSTNIESVCVGICHQFVNTQSCTIPTTLPTQSPTISPVPSYSNPTVDTNYTNYSNEDDVDSNDRVVGKNTENGMDSDEKSSFTPGAKEILIGLLLALFSFLLISSFVIHRRLYGPEKLEDESQW
eukprot:CAMPEP_0197841524 /NCGR_PEP_ID=MMETSP1437-20131217/46232_1 /TAXON_ID=49252 ORGANISM="Eucampia antarctica, Strain CCMP1452" /NCGR_SAMPLE_ID=MMETSP1437 /ASSEMBLY_ACC=CAM_ASM_001096 /LENGTH=516 /DNA_ID=CAMNT_0043451299 /DNA_START=477 /DNA_END=2024 /DNA_ORIENTATION=-